MTITVSEQYSIEEEDIHLCVRKAAGVKAWAEGLDKTRDTAITTAVPIVLQVKGWKPSKRFENPKEERSDRETQPKKKNAAIEKIVGD